MHLREIGWGGMEWTDLSQEDPCEYDEYSRIP
jgi:hypothetical protein